MGHIDPTAALFRYYVNGAAPVTVRGLSIPNSGYYYSTIALLSSDDLSANPTVSVDTRANTGASWTLGTDTVAPANATSLTGVVVADGAVTLHWVDPVAADLDHLEVTWPGQSAITVAVGVQTYAATGLVNGSPIVFTLKSVDAKGNKSSGVTVTKTPLDATPPAEVTNLNANHASGEVELVWVDPVTADFNHVEITFPGQVGGALSVAATKQLVIIQGLTNGTNYVFTVKTVDTLGNKSAGITTQATPAAVVADVTATAEVTSLVSSDAGGHIGHLTWVDPTAQDFDHLEITWTGMATPQIVLKGVQQFTTVALTPGSFTFTVKSVDFAGNKTTGATSTHSIA